MRLLTDDPARRARMGAAGRARIERLYTWEMSTQRLLAALGLKPMRLAYPDPHPVPDTGTESLQILYTADALGNAGIEVSLITPRPVTTIAPREILGHELSPNVRGDVPGGEASALVAMAFKPAFYRAAARLIAQHPPDAIYARNLKLAEHLLYRLPVVPLVFETHEPFTLTYREEHPRMSLRQHHKLAALARREEFVYRHARGLVAVPPFLIDVLRKEFGVETPAVEAPNGVDLRQAEAPARIEANPVPVLLYLGSLHPWKGVETLVRALPLVSGERAAAYRRWDAGTHRGTANAGAIVRRRGPRRVPWTGGTRETFRIHAPCRYLSAAIDRHRHRQPPHFANQTVRIHGCRPANCRRRRAGDARHHHPGVHALTAEVGNPAAFAEAINVLLADSALRALGCGGTRQGRRFYMDKTR